MIPDGDDHYAMMFPGRRSRNRIAFKCEVETNPPVALLTSPELVILVGEHI